jgi:hypothetical protein
VELFEPIGALLYFDWMFPRLESELTYGREAVVAATIWIFWRFTGLNFVFYLFAYLLRPLMVHLVRLGKFYELMSMTGSIFILSSQLSHLLGQEPILRNEIFRFFVMKENNVSLWTNAEYLQIVFEFYCIFFHQSAYWLLLKQLPLGLFEIYFLAISPRWTTLYFMTVRGGYHHTNPWIVFILAIYAVYEFIPPTGHFHDPVNPAIENEQNVNVDLISWIQNPTALSQFNSNQMLKLKDILSGALDNISRKLSGSDPTRKDTEEIVTDHCVICLENTPKVVFHPCMHKCVCEECFEGVLKMGVGNCPVCKVPILEWFVESTNHLLKTDIDYQIETQSVTEREVAKLYQYMAEHPKARDLLKKK